MKDSQRATEKSSALLPLLDERVRRLVAANKAITMKYGTIYEHLRELERLGMRAVFRYLLRK